MQKEITYSEFIKLPPGILFYEEICGLAVKGETFYYSDEENSHDFNYISLNPKYSLCRDGVFDFDNQRLFTVYNNDMKQNLINFIKASN